MEVRSPQGPLPPYRSDLPIEPLTRAKLRELAKEMNDLGERIEAVGLTDSTRGEVSRLRLTICHYLRWPGLCDERKPPWAGGANDVLRRALRPLGWCYESDTGNHPNDEIVAELRRLGRYAAKVAGGQAEADRGWTPEEAAEIVAKLRTLAAAVDCAPTGHHGKALAARIEWALADVYGWVCCEQAESGAYRQRTPEGDEIDLAPLISGTMNLLREIERRSAPDGMGDKLRTAADGMEAAFAGIDKDRPAETTTGDDGSGTRQKRPKKRTRRSKRPAEVLKEARERHAAKILAQRPGITSRELGQELDCDASTVTRLQAWAKRGVNDHPKPPTGIRLKRDIEAGGLDIDATG